MSVRASVVSVVCVVCVVLAGTGCYDLSALRGNADLASSSTMDLGASGDGGGADPCPTFALFCDDFETGGAGKWDRTQQGNIFVNVTVSATRAYRGMWSLGVVGDVSGSSNDGYVGKTLSPAPSSGMLAMRAHVYMTSAAGNGTYFLSAHNRTGGHGVVTGIEDGRWFVQDRSFANHYGMGTLAAGRWICLELQIELGASGRMRLFLDGNQNIDVSGPTLPTGGIDEVQVGFVNSPGDVRQEVFVDNVAIATQPLGCD